MALSRGALAALTALTAGGCELLADIPSATTRDTDGGISGSDADGGDDDGGVMGCASGCTDPARPVCGADDTCRACDADSECGANGVCMIDGACADEAAILYVAPDGTGADCSVAAPCAITQAHASLSTTKYIVKLAPGSYAVATSLALDGQAPLIMFAGQGTVLTAMQDYNPVFNVSTGRLDVTGVDFNSQPLTYAATCPDATLNMTRVTIQNGTVGLFSLNPCKLSLDRVVVQRSNTYGVYIAVGSEVSIRNSLFVNNGNASNALSPLHLPGVTGVIEFTTIADNISNGTPPSITCDTAELVVRNSISFGHPAPINAACSVSYSNIEGYAGAGTNNVTMNPEFAGSGDYHLMTTSPMRELADPATGIPFDFDGQPRAPLGSRADIGFDEVL